MTNNKRYAILKCYAYHRRYIKKNIKLYIKRKGTPPTPQPPKKKQKTKKKNDNHKKKKP